VPRGGAVPQSERLKCKCPGFQDRFYFLHRISMIAFVDLVLTSSVLGQTVPASPEHPWHGPAELTMQEGRFDALLLLGRKIESSILSLTNEI
jgi:hypothetical protein